MLALAALTALSLGTPDRQANPPATPALERVELEGVQPLYRVGPVLLGGQPTQAGFERLAAQGVSMVVDLRLGTEARGFDQRALLERLDLSYEVVGFDGPATLTDSIFDRVRQLMLEHRSPKRGKLLLHGDGRGRAAAIWLATRVLDEGVTWELALLDARTVGLASTALETVTRNYVLGAGKQALGATKLRIRRDFPEVARLSVTELDARLRQPGPAPLLLDVRAAREYQISHLKGARRADDITTARRWLGDAPPEREVVVYCSVGQRSANLARQLSRAGYTHVRNLEGSLFEWANTGHPVYRGEEVVGVVHPFNEKWGRLLDGSLHRY